MSVHLEPKFYRKAAQRIIEGKNIFCCSAIAEAMRYRGGHYHHVRAFFEFFHPTDQLNHRVFWDYPTTPESQEARVIALLLMAEIAKDC